MRYLRNFFSKKENPVLTTGTESLYKKISPQEFVDYDDNHSKDGYDDGEINRIESFFKYKIFGKNTNSCLTICEKSKVNMLSPIFFIIEKYVDGWFIVHTCKLSSAKKGFDTLDHFLCDTLDGVEQIVKK